MKKVQRNRARFMGDKREIKKYGKRGIWKLNENSGGGM